MAISFIGAGLLEVRRAITTRAERQVTLDRRTGEFAINLRATLITLEQSYSRMEVYRVITLAACPVIPTPICPEVMEGFHVAARTERLIQLAVKNYWKEQTLAWKLYPARGSSYPEFNFEIAHGDERDLLVLWKHEFEVKTSNPIQLRLNHFWLQSASEVRRKTNGWAVAWTK